MKLEIFSVRDDAVEAFLQPFFAPTKGSALRSMTDAANDTKHQFFAHAADYTLYTLGYFDDATGIFDTAPPIRMVNCLELQIKSSS